MFAPIRTFTLVVIGSLHHGQIWCNFHAVLREAGVSKTGIFEGVSAVLAGGLAVMIATPSRRTT